MLLIAPVELRHVIWTARVQCELEAIRTYVGEVNPTAAQRLALRVIAAAHSLIECPHRYRTTGAARELVVVRPYIIRYRVRPEAVVIERVRHAAQAS